MHRSFSLVAVLFLCGSSFIVVGQTNTAKIQAQVEANRSQVDRLAATPSGGERADPTENAKKFYRQGLNFFEAGQLLPAAENFREAIRFDPEFGDAYSALGRTYFKLQEWQKAFDTLQRAAALNSKKREPNESNVKTRSEQEAQEKTLAAKVPVNSTAVQPKPLRSLTAPNSGVDKQSVDKTVQPPAPQNAPLLKPTTTPAQPNHAVAFNRLNTNSEKDSKKPDLMGNLVPKVSLAPKAMKVAVAPPSSAVVALDDIVLSPILSFKQLDVASASSEEPPIPEQVAVATEVSQPTTAASTINAAPLAIPNAELSPTKIYRVGPNDVLDVRLNNSSAQQSTLFTITPAGLLEHPMLAEPMLVSGLTVEEIGAQIEKDLVKRAIAENPKAVVGVRDYASHSILVSG